MSRFALFITGFMIVISPSLPGDGHARDLYFSPLFSYESGDGGPAFDGLGPVLDFSGTHTAVRPLYYRDRENETSCIVYPLGKTTPDHAYFAPFMRWRTEGDNSSFDLFPYFSGTHEGRNYSGLFPLYGKAYHRYGYDEARFALWPLYTETQRDGGTTYTLLWPVFSYRNHELFRVFPLYGTENSADSAYTFALWPVFHHEQRTDGGGMAAVLPLFRTEYGQPTGTHLCCGPSSPTTGMKRPSTQAWTSPGPSYGWRGAATRRRGSFHCTGSRTRDRSSAAWQSCGPCG